jgi:hypothetical protein
LPEPSFGLNGCQSILMISHVPSWYGEADPDGREVCLATGAAAYALNYIPCAPCGTAQMVSRLGPRQPGQWLMGENQDASARWRAGFP